MFAPLRMAACLMAIVAGLERGRRSGRADFGLIVEANCAAAAGKCIDRFATVFMTSVVVILSGSRIEKIRPADILFGSSKSCGERCEKSRFNHFGRSVDMVPVGLQYVVRSRQGCAAGRQAHGRGGRKAPLTPCPLLPHGAAFFPGSGRKILSRAGREFVPPLRLQNCT